MDNARLSRFPHLSWLPLRLACSPHAPDGGTLVTPVHHVAHLIHKSHQGRHSVRWISRGRETRWDADHHTVHFAPADGEHFTAVTSAVTEYAGTVICIPKEHLETISDSEGVKPVSSWRRILTHDDEVLEACMKRLSTPAMPDGDSAEPHKDELARRLVLRLHELCGGRPPDWRDDSSMFTRRMLDDLVGYLDDHLRRAPSSSDMARLAGLSPSHFAKKFRQSTGLSLQRFINRRRIVRSLTLLKTDSSLASIAQDLGFPSQSHLTRLFSGLTGLTPARYRKLQRAVLG